MAANIARARPWSTDEDQYLINTQGSSVGEQAQHLQRAYSSVSSRRVVLIRQGQLTPHFVRRPWSADEDARLLELLQDGLSLPGIAAAMGRSYSAICTRCTEIGGATWLRRPQDGHQVRDAGEIAALFGVAPSQVKKWIAAGWIKARRTSRKRGARWLITDAALWDLITNRRSWFAWKAERIIDADWREQALWERRRARACWLTTPQVARLLGCPRHHVYNLIVAGKLPAARHGREHYYVWSEDLKAMQGQA